MTSFGSGRFEGYTERTFSQFRPSHEWKGWPSQCSNDTNLNGIKEQETGCTIKFQHIEQLIDNSVPLGGPGMKMLDDVGISVHLPNLIPVILTPGARNSETALF